MKLDLSRVLKIKYERKHK